MKYGYTRTSRKNNPDGELQRQALVEAGVDVCRIFSDQTSARKEARNRAGWSSLESRLRRGDELVVWRIDRIGHSMIDVISTIDDLLNRGVKVRSLSDDLDPSQREGRLMLELMATLAKYQRGLVRERVQSGVDDARARGIRLGRPPVDPAETARKVRMVQYYVLMDGMTVESAAQTVGWSRATYYRHKSLIVP